MAAFVVGLTVLAANTLGTPLIGHLRRWSDQTAQGARCGERSKPNRIVPALTRGWPASLTAGLLACRGSGWHADRGEVLLLTIATSLVPATDLGYLLHIVRTAITRLT